ncbi:hypothetical protein QTP88_012641 [Uroleucon formosanum]
MPTFQACRNCGCEASAMTKRWNLLLEKSKSAKSYTSLVNEDQNLYERELEDINNISLHADSESKIENDDQKNENISKMTGLKKNISNKSKSNDLFLVVQSFQSVVDKLSVLRTRDQYNAFVTEAKTIKSNFDIFTDVLGPAEFPKRTKKMPLQIDENTRGISLSEEDKHRTIYFETLDNMIGELNERMNGFSKVLDLFYFLNPDELKKINIEDVKRKCEALSYYFDSKESENTDNILSYLTFIIKHSLSDVLPQIEILLKIFFTLPIGNASAERAMSNISYPFYAAHHRDFFDSSSIQTEPTRQ